MLQSLAFHFDLRVKFIDLTTFTNAVNRGHCVLVKGHSGDRVSTVEASRVRAEFAGLSSSWVLIIKHDRMLNVHVSDDDKSPQPELARLNPGDVVILQWQD